MRIFFPVEIFEESKKMITWQPRDLCIYEIKNEEYIPLWLENIEIPEVDIAIIPFDETLESLKQMGIAIIPVNSNELELTEFEIKAGMDAFLLGYPLGLVGGGHLPIWKRGSLASEYLIDIDGLPKYFIDTATTKTGMSGSPVFIKSDGLTFPKNAKSMDDMILGSCYSFGGIYSGRSQLMHNGEIIFPDLAIVWKEKAISKIIENETVSNYKFYG